MKIRPGARTQKRIGFFVWFDNSNNLGSKSPVSRSHDSSGICNISRWWPTQIYLLCSPRKVGEDEPDFDEHIFQDGLVQPPTHFFSL